MKVEMMTDVVGFSRSPTRVGLPGAFELTGNVAFRIISLTIKKVSHNLSFLQFLTNFYRFYLCYRTACACCKSPALKLPGVA